MGKYLHQKKLIFFLLYSLPILFITKFILDFGVNVPFYDQWVLPKLFDKIVTGTINFQDIFELHNTHRIVFPRIIFISLGLISNWNIRLELFLSLGLAIFTFILIYKISSLTSSNHNYLFYFANLLTALLFFSAVQLENWLWGFQIALFLINFCVILSCLILIQHQFNLRLKLFFAAIPCLIASFSSLQGLISWLALIPLILEIQEEKKQKKKTLIFWLFLFIISNSIYFTGYIREPRTNILPFWERLLTSIHFLFNVIAAPLTSSYTVSGWLGSFIFLNFIGFLVYGVLRRSQQPNHLTESLIPWLSIGLFSLLSSVLISVGRADFGANYAVDTSRYTTHSLLLIIAIIQLWQIVISEVQPLNKTHQAQILYGFMAGILVCLIGVRTEEAIAIAQNDLPDKQRSRTCLELINYLEDSSFFQSHPERCLWRSSKTTWWIREGVEHLQNAKVRKFAQNVIFKAEPQQLYGYIDDPLTSKQPLIVKQQDQLTLRGWAIFPESKKQPQLVFFAQENHRSFFANAQVGLPSPDIAEALNSSRYNQARWQIEIPAETLPVGQTTLKAWVYDPEQNAFIQLKGEVLILVQKA